MEKRRGHIPSSSIHSAENHRGTFRGAPTRGEQVGEPGEERICRGTEKAERSGGLYEIKTKSVGKHIVSFGTDWHTRRHSLSPTYSLSLSPCSSLHSPSSSRTDDADVGCRSSFSLLLYRCFSLRRLLPRGSARVVAFEGRGIMETSARAVREEHVNKASRGRVRSRPAGRGPPKASPDSECPLKNGGNTVDVRRFIPAFRRDLSELFASGSALPLLAAVTRSQKDNTSGGISSCGSR